MAVVIVPTRYGTAGRVVGALQDFVGRYLDGLAVGDDPIAARGIGLVIDRFAISVRRAARALLGIDDVLVDAGNLKAAIPLSKLVPGLMSPQGWCTRSAAWRRWLKSSSGRHAERGHVTGRH